MRWVAGAVSACVLCSNHRKQQLSGANRWSIHFLHLSLSSYLSSKRRPLDKQHTKHETKNVKWLARHGRSTPVQTQANVLRWCQQIPKYKVKESWSSPRLLFCSKLRIVMKSKLGAAAFQSYVVQSESGAMTSPCTPKRILSNKVDWNAEGVLTHPEILCFRVWI